MFRTFSLLFRTYGWLPCIAACTQSTWQHSPRMQSRNKCATVAVCSRQARGKRKYMPSKRELLYLGGISPIYPPIYRVYLKLSNAAVPSLCYVWSLPHKFRINYRTVCNIFCMNAFCHMIIVVDYSSGSIVHSFIRQKCLPLILL